MNELDFSAEEASLIFNLMEQRDHEFNKYIDEKVSSLKKEYADSDIGYMFDAHDYIMMGKNRLLYRQKMREFVGNEKYERLSKFIRDFNQGLHSEQFVPIDF